MHSLLYFAKYITNIPKINASVDSIKSIKLIVLSFLITNTTTIDQNITVGRFSFFISNFHK